MENFRKIEVGDILAYSICYSMEIPVFLQVIKKTQKTVVVKEVEKDSYSDGYLSGTCVPKKNVFVSSGKEKRYQIQCDSKEQHIKVHGYIANIWKGEALRYDYMD